MGVHLLGEEIDEADRGSEKCPCWTPCPFLGQHPNGFKYDVDLCEKCSAELYAAVMKWADLGVLKGEPKALDLAKQPRQVTVPTPVRRAAADPVAAEVRRTQAMSRPDLPATAQRWIVTPHAADRMRERGLDLYEVLMCAERPETVTPRTSAKLGLARDGDVEERYRADVKLIVDPHSNEILTAMKQSTSSIEKASA